MLQFNIYKDCKIWLAARLSIVLASLAGFAINQFSNIATDAVLAESLPLQELK